MLGPLVVDGQCEVNSRHHQSIKSVGSGLAPTAISPDGVIEAAEHAAQTFCVGVQWHPENFWRTRRFQPLFDAFVRAAGGRLTLLNPSPSVWQVFRITRLDTVLEFVKPDAIPA